MIRIKKMSFCLILIIISFCPCLFGATLGDVKSFRDTGQGIELNCINALVLLEFITPEIVRVRVGVNNKYIENYSYALRDDLEKKETIYIIKDKGNSILLSSKALDIIINKKPTLINFLDKDGFSLCKDFSPLSFEPSEEGYSVTCTKSLSYDEHFYGLGEKTGRLDKRRKKYEMWNFDAVHYDQTSDPLYQSYPFFIGLKGHKGFGIFFDNTYRTYFDMGHSYEDRYIFSSEGGELDYYFIGGPLIENVVKRYAYLTGTMPLPPLWALGHMFCRYSYYPEKQILDIAKRAREKKIPLDVIWLDIHYMDGYRCFTWDKSRFPDIKAMVSKLHDMGYKVISMIDPGIKVDPNYFVFKSGIEEDIFLKYDHGGLCIGKVWAEESVFADFSKPKVRQWWGNLYKTLTDVGIDGFWNDMNEPTVFDTPSKTINNNVIFYDFGLYSSHRKMHNVFGLNMVRATHEGVSKLIGNKRPFILSRAGFCGLQRYAASWTGDNTSNYKHLALQIPMFLNMGLSGTPFIGSDIGGFFGSPDGELLTRWYQASVLVPLMRTHTCRGTYDQEPWVYGEPYLSIIRKYINLRYSLVPYLYSCFYEASKHGVPILRPLIYEYQNDPNTYTTDNEFLVGRQILVAPVVKEATKAIIIYLPTGNWYDYYNKEIIEGHKSIHYDAPLEVLPVFIKEGSVIAKKAVGQYTGEKPINTLTLEVYPLVSQNSCDSILYIDDGKTKDSPFSLFNFKVVKDGKNLSINISKEGEFNKLKGFKVKVFSPPPKELILNGQSSPFKYAKGIVFFSLDKDVKKVLIKY